VKPVIYTTSISLFHCTRNFQILVIRLENYVAIQENDNDDNSLSLIEFYRKRPRNVENITLFELSKKHFKRSRNQLIICRKDQIVHIYPKIILQQLPMLYKLPWCKEHLKYENEIWKSAYLRSDIAELLHIIISWFLLEKEDEFDDDNINNNDEQIRFNERDWIVLAAVIPDVLPAFYLRFS